MYTEEMLKTLPEEYKGEITQGFHHLSDQYRDRLEKEFLELEKEDKEEYDHRVIVKITCVKKQAKNLIRYIEAVSEVEKEVCEIHKIKYSGGFELIIGPISERRYFYLWDGIEI